jgi:hypothetical protein
LSRSIIGRLSASGRCGVAAALWLPSCETHDHLLGRVFSEK